MGHTSGLHRVWVEAEDEAGNIKQMGDYSFIRQIPATGLQLTILEGDAIQFVNERTIIQAIITPITYVWQASEQATRTISATANPVNTQFYSWATTGPKVLTVTAYGPLNNITATTTITIIQPILSSDGTQIYLPLVMK